MTTEVDAFKSPDLGESSRYLKHKLLSSSKHSLGTSEVEEFNQNEQNPKSSFEIVYVFFPAVLDTNGKMTTFFVLPILQKLKPEEFFSS